MYGEDFSSFFMSLENDNLLSNYHVCLIFFFFLGKI